MEDPRASGWPCQGNRDPSKVLANGSMQMKRCSKCNVECEYIPRQGAAGNPRKLDADPAIVSAALHRLQTEEVTAESCTGEILDATIKLCHQEERIRKAMAKSNKARNPHLQRQPVQLRPHEGSARMDTTPARETPRVQQIHTPEFDPQTPVSPVVHPVGPIGTLSPPVSQQNTPRAATPTPSTSS